MGSLVKAALELKASGAVHVAFGADGSLSVSWLPAVAEQEKVHDFAEFDKNILPFLASG